MPSLPSFEDWSDYVRSALVWLGRVDPVDTMKCLQDDDPEHQLRTVIFRGLHEAFGSRMVAVKDLVTVAQETVAMDPENDFGVSHRDQSPRYPDLLDGLLDVAGRNGVIQPESLGLWLRSNKGRIADGLKLGSKTTGGRAKWSVTKIT